MKELVLEMPDNSGLDIISTKRFIAAKLFESGKLSLGQASEMAGLSKIAFSEILKDFQVSLINYSTREAINDAFKI